MENNKFISYIDEIAVTDESSKKITIDNLNLRKSSSTKDDIILTIPKGAEVYLKIKQDKINVFTEDGSKNILDGVNNDIGVAYAK